MLLKRVIPSLLYSNHGLYKTIRFGKKKYIGDVINTVRLFNDLGADELILLDIDATKNNVGPNFELINSVASECFMPLTYGGGVGSIAEAEALLRLGVEKISVNSAALREPEFVNKLSVRFGSSTIVVSIDLKKNLFGSTKVFRFTDRRLIKADALELIRNVESLGAGELLITNVDQEGTQTGFDTKCISLVAEAVSIPVIVNGGCGNFSDIEDAFEAGASAVSCSSKFIYDGPHNAVLINYLTEDEYSRLNPT